MKFLFRVIAILSVFVSCKPKELDIDVPQTEVKLVVASQFLPDNSLAVVLSKNFSALKDEMPRVDSTGVLINEELIIKNAIVTLTNGVNTYELQEVSPGVYGTEPLDKIDYQNYRIVINHPESGMQASSSTTMMPDITFDSVSVAAQTDPKYPATIYYSITDRPNENNWYAVHYFLKNQKDTVTNKSNIDYIAKRMLEQQNIVDLYTDADFTSGKLSVTKRLQANEISDTLAIAVSNITHEYYAFLTAQKRSGQLINQLRGEVINFPTNIQNGYGFFNLHKPDVRVLQIEK